MKEILSTVAGIIFLVAFVPYIMAILKKETQPRKATWLIWATIDTIVFAGMYAEKTLNGQIIGAVIGAWIVAVLALVYGEAGWSKLEKYSLAGATIGVALWLASGNALLGLVMSLTLAVVGATPTIASVWETPHKEDKLAWVLYWISCLFAVASVAIADTWTLEHAGQPLTFLLIESIVMWGLFLRPILRKRKTE